MNKVFFPGCRIRRACPTSSAKLEAYLKDRYGIPAAGCCKEDHPLLEQPDSSAVIICNNCIHDLAALTHNRRREYALDIINRDTDFPFPDYGGRSFVLQDCGHGYGDSPVDETVRSLLKKLHITCIEQPFSARVPFGMPMPEQEKLVKANAATFPQEDVIVYCGSCRLWMRQSGKQAVHIIELLFLEEEA